MVDDLLLTGGRVALPDGRIAPGSVLVRTGRIAAVGDDADAEAVASRIDVTGCLVAPGLIDLHVHGAAGQDFSGDRSGPLSEHDLMTILRHLAADGVTSVQPSLVSAAVPDMAAGAAAISAAAGRLPEDTAGIVGVHLEGPFLARAQCGAQDPRALVTPTATDVDRLVDRTGVTMVTIAPELPGAMEAIERFDRAGVVVAAGHSDATGEQVTRAVQHGLRHMTHLWSGQSTVVRHGPWRIPGLLEAALSSSVLSAEIIADGRHLPGELIEIARRCLGNNLLVVSDGTAGTQMPDGFRYSLGTVHCEVSDGVGVVVGRDSFGGSTTSLRGMLAHLVLGCGWDLAEALAAVTSRPARVAGIADRKGSVAAGMDADLVVLDPDFSVVGTVLRGHWRTSESLTRDGA